LIIDGYVASPQNCSTNTIRVDLRGAIDKRRWKDMEADSITVIRWPTVIALQPQSANRRWNSMEADSITGIHWPTAIVLHPGSPKRRWNAVESDRSTGTETGIVDRGLSPRGQ